jgi:hypothetical protein
MNRLQAIRERRLQLAAEAQAQREALRARHSEVRGELVVVTLALGLLRLFKAPKSAALTSVAALLIGWLVNKFVPRGPDLR